MKTRCLFLGGPLDGWHVLPDSVGVFNVAQYVKEKPSPFAKASDKAPATALLVSKSAYHRTAAHVFVHESELCPP